MHQIEGIILRLECNLIIGFLYCRSTPNDSEIKALKKHFGECDVLMGDLNLSHRVLKDQEKLTQLCDDSKVSVLHEITRSISRNQLDYILINKELSQRCYVTSYNNFINTYYYL